jgi:chromosome segregation ATPase
MESYHELEQRFTDECEKGQEKEAMVERLREAIGDVQARLDDRETEIISLQRQLGSKAAEAGNTLVRLKEMEETVARLNLDLDNMTRENQAVHLELAEMQDLQAGTEAQLYEQAERVRQVNLRLLTLPHAHARAHTHTHTHTLALLLYFVCAVRRDCRTLCDIQKFTVLFHWVAWCIGQ